jgi:GT2 family glycosyltransferase
VDLGYRAWRRGHRILHVPEAVCHHDGVPAPTDASPAERERIAFRNRILFHLRNLQDPALRARALGACTAWALFDTAPERLLGLADALARYEASEPRLEDGLSDAEILERVRPAE